MADGAVPSVAPETVAFKNLELATGVNNPGNLFVNAFFKGAEINRRRQQLEQQLQIAQLKNYTDEAYHRNQMENWQTQAAIKMQELNLRGVIAENSANNMATRLDILREGVSVNQQKIDLKTLQDQELMDQTGQFYSALHDSGVKEGTPEFWPTFVDLKSKYPRFVQSKDALALSKSEGDKHNLTASQLLNANNTLMNAFDTEIKNTYFGGAYVDKQIFVHPEWWQPQYVDKSGNPVQPQLKKDDKGKFVPLAPGDPGYVEGATKTANVSYDRGPQYAAAGPSRWITMPAAVQQQYMNRYKKLMEDRAKIGDQVYDPSLGVYPIDRQGNKPPDPKDPRPIFKDANGNRAYKNPDGTYEPVR